MSYLLDSNVVIAMLRGQRAMIARLQRHEPDDIAISSLVAHELYYGAFKSRRELMRIDALRFYILDFDRDDARHSGEIRAHLDTLGQRIGPYDVLIAGQALARGLTLVTRNVREFARVDGLSIENWED